MGSVGDYPAAAATIDVIGHVSRAPCTLCTFRRLHASTEDSSRYGYTKDVDSGNSTFLRHAERNNSIRKAQLSAGDANYLGMVDSARMSTRPGPLLLLYNTKQEKQDRIPFTNSGKPVVSGLFDPYRCNIVAPDHLLTGLSKDAINTVFQCLPTETMRAHADAYICSALRQNRLLTQRSVYNSKTRTIHSMTLSEIYRVILVASDTLRSIISSCPAEHPSTHAFDLLRRLQSLIALTYWYPDPEIDREDGCHCSIERRNAHLSELKSTSKEYVRTVDEFCSKFHEQGSNLEKPNLHRLIELYEHTIPSFGHVREVMELVFEAAHQPLKRGIGRSNNHEAHIFACEHSVGNNWQGRIASLSRELARQDPLRRKQAYRGLRHLFIGADAEFLDEERDQQFIKETDALIERQFTLAIRKQFKRSNLVSNFVIDKVLNWKARTKTTLGKLSKVLGVPTTLIKQVLAAAGRWILAVYPPIRTDREDTGGHHIKMFIFAKRVKENENGRQLGTVKGFDVLSPNTVVEVHTSPEALSGKILTHVQGAGSVQVFLVVVAVLHREHDMIWLVCARGSLTDDWIQVSAALDQHNFHISCLTPQVRRVAAYHMCAENGQSNICTIDVNRNSVRHSNSVLDGAKMYIQTRKDGYPPRQG